MKTLAILVAAGRGERLGSDQPKAFLPIAGRTLLLWAAMAFEEAPSVDSVVAVVPSSGVERAQEVLEPIRKLRGVTSGGSRRQDSVLEGLKLAPEDFDQGIVLVHDAARPFVDPELIEAVVSAARRTGAAIPVVGLVDTVKRVDGKHITATVDRETLGAAQTPQGFRYALLARAYEEAFRNGLTLSDDAMAVELLGEPVEAVPGSARNRKITVPDDVVWAESILGGERARLRQEE
jgi:2-C-methyl-D-erythritol 4-phosphate cytidylyltransferase